MEIRRMASDGKAKTVYWMNNRLYLNITNECSNCCFFCLKRYRQGIDGFKLKLPKEPTLKQITKELEQVLHMRNWSEIVFCGFGEPTERLNELLIVTQWIRQHYDRPLVIRVNTNGHGYLLNPKRNVVWELKAAGVDRVSVSLNAGDKQTYTEVCKPIVDNAFEAVLDFVNKAKVVLEVEATAVRMPEVDIEKTKAVADALGVKFRIREYISCFF